MLKNNIGNGTTEFFCQCLSIDKELFYTYISEINLFFSEFLTIGGFYIPWQIEYDRYLKRYVLIMEEKE
jgi:hypothetical protein